MVRPEFILDHWKAVREDSALAVEQMPADKLDYRPQEDMMSFREVARHIVEASRALTGLMLDGEMDLTGPDFRKKLERYLRPFPEDQAAIGAELRASVNEHCEALAGCPPEFFAELITKWDGARLTRLEMMQFVKEHELTHRMQLFMYLRMNGVVPPTTRRKMAAKR